MKKLFIAAMAAALVLTSCSTTESGAVNGASMGSVFGSALGGLLGGYRGHGIGTMVGMVAGGATGAIIGSRREAARREEGLERREENRERIEQRRMQREQQTTEGRQSSTRLQKPARTSDYGQGYSLGLETNDAAQSPLTLQNLRFVGQDGNDAINRGEICTLVFELANASGQTVYDIVPYISELAGNEHISISPSTSIETLAHGDAIRYTATLKADSRLKVGTATFRIAVSTDGSEFVRLRDFSVATAK